MKLSSAGGDSVSKKCKHAVVGSSGVCVWRESGVRCWRVWQEFCFILIYFIKKFLIYFVFPKLFAKIMLQ
jgi:hypothetical protein